MDAKHGRVKTTMHMADEARKFKSRVAENTLSALMLYSCCAQEPTCSCTGRTTSLPDSSLISDLVYLD